MKYLARTISKPATKLLIYVESRAEAEFIQALLQLMDAEGISHGELARKAKISQPTISRLLNGKHSPTLKTIERIAGAFGREPSLRLVKK